MTRFAMLFDDGRRTYPQKDTRHHSHLLEMTWATANPTTNLGRSTTPATTAATSRSNTLTFSSIRSPKSNRRTALLRFWSCKFSITAYIAHSFFAYQLLAPCPELSDAGNKYNSLKPRVVGGLLFTPKLRQLSLQLIYKRYF